MLFDKLTKQDLMYVMFAIIIQLNFYDEYFSKDIKDGDRATESAFFAVRVVLRLFAVWYLYRVILGKSTFK